MSEDEGILAEEEAEAEVADKPLPDKPKSTPLFPKSGKGKRRSPPQVPRRDYPEDGGDEWGDDETLEYKSSTNEVSETEEGLGLRPPKPVGHNLRWTRSAKLLTAYGVASILLGLCVAGAGVTSFVYNPLLTSRQSFQMEWKWSNLMLLASGGGAVTLTRRQSLSAISGTLAASLVAGAMGASTAVVHVVNVYFRREDAAYLERAGKDTSTATSLATTSGFLVVVGLVAAAVSALLYRHTLHVAGKNFGFNRHIEKLRLRLSLLGLAQIFLGITITCWWIAIEALFQGHNVDFHSLPTSEVLSHGLVMICAGYVQMMATAKGSQPLLVAGTLLSGAAAFLAAYFSAKPLSLIYLTVEMNAGTGEDSLDIKFLMFLFLTLFYLLQLAASLYSFTRLLHYSAGDRRERKSLRLAERSGRLLGTLAFAQLVLGVCYALLEVVSVGLVFAYKMDFSAVPVMVVAAGLLGQACARRRSVWLGHATLAASAFCATHALREVYVFAYHMVAGGSTPADGQGGPVWGGGTVALHFLLAIVALAEAVLATAHGVALGRALLASLATLLNRQRFQTELRVLSLLALGQCVGSLVAVLGGLGAFVGGAAHLEVAGDIVVTTAALLGLGGVLAHLAVGRRNLPSLLLPAVGTQYLALLVVWQKMDELAYLVHNHLGEKAADVVAAEVGHFGLTSFLLLLLLGLWLLTLPSLLLLGEMAENAAVSKAVDEKSRQLLTLAVSAQRDDENKEAELVIVDSVEEKKEPSE